MAKKIVNFLEVMKLRIPSLKLAAFCHLRTGLGFCPKRKVSSEPTIQGGTVSLKDDDIAFPKKNL